ncbi:lipase family protein (macronuclear) [Tetrahymena thermophila SB210]|uniref:Lipase family protein n=1 Tax=Tetrahymena thermophila (strain SB210) TaxID=312017 RepID=Q237S4_TETTS|nr:lipase family protein [Tetrahymena thermophila SB210]EAR92667.1 lipase family protein [Tetrahymena thermophila SB210]|eukprot:XP_001012912.1 lipase family protein [Tetrahymena thermophila SB210]
MKLQLLLLVCLSFAACQSFTYTQSLAQDLAGFSLASYCNPKSIEQWNCGCACDKNPQGLRNVTILFNSTLQASGYLGYSTHHDAIVVVFRGTVPWLIENWIADLNTFKTQYPLCQNCYVHQGFYNQFKQLKSQLVTSFTSLRQLYPNAKVFVTGHSLGAAMSAHSIPVIYQLNGNKPIDAFYNYGCPRVGDQTYANWFNSQNFALEYGRINNAADPVPHLPPLLYPFSFFHYNHEIFYPSFVLFGNQHNQCQNAETIFGADGVIIAANVLDHLTYFGWDWSGSILTCQ